jgi:low temperature requirement protein LtrA
MVVRAHSEPHRQTSWLELLFDLSIVVAVAQSSHQLEHALAEGRVAEGLVGYLIVFAAIWWAWMAFTWFGNVFDSDDVPYRLFTFVMIAGSLGLAAGVPQIAYLDFRVGVLSYVVMRLAYVAQWARVLQTGNPTWRKVASRMIVLVTINQAGWVAFLWVPTEWKIQVFVVWFAVDIATPYVAGWDARAGGHHHHIIERYGLFTIIVLGESMTAATMALSEALESRVDLVPLLTLAIAALVIVVSLWWIYFDFTTGGAPAGTRTAQYFWGYAHFFVFSGAAAVGAGIALAASWLIDPVQIRLPESAVVLIIASAVAVFLITVALIEVVAEKEVERGTITTKTAASLLAIGAALAAPKISVPGSALLIAAALVVLVAYGAQRQQRLYLHSRDMLVRGLDDRRKTHRLEETPVKVE